MESPLTEKNVSLEENKWVFQTFFHQGWTEAITCKVRAVKECGVPGNGRLPGQLYQELCSYSSSAVPANQKRNQLKFCWGKQEEEAFRKIKIHVPSQVRRSWHSLTQANTQSSVQKQASVKGYQRPYSRRQTEAYNSTGTLHQLDNDRNREEVQSNQERCFGIQMGQRETENLPTWSTQIQSHDCSQTKYLCLTK